MNLTKKKLMAVLSIMFAATLMTNSPSQAGGKAPGEGFYAGAFMGHGTGILQAEVSVDATISNNTAATFETDRGGLGLSGIQGGVWLGWGMKTADDLYFGAEITGIGSDEKIELSSSVGINSTKNEAAITSITAQRKWSGAGSVRAGYYVNSETLLALSAGVAASQFDVDIGSASETYYAGGPQVGASLETQLSKIDPNLGLRMEFVYTNYLTAEINGIEGVGGNGSGGTGNDSELTGHDTAARIGVTYRF
jgi:hypothetical protein